MSTSTLFTFLCLFSGRPPLCDRKLNSLAHDRTFDSLDCDEYVTNETKPCQSHSFVKLPVRHDSYNGALDT